MEPSRTFDERGEVVLRGQATVVPPRRPAPPAPLPLEPAEAG